MGFIFGNMLGVKAKEENGSPEATSGQRWRRGMGVVGVWRVRVKIPVRPVGWKLSALVLSAGEEAAKTEEAILDNSVAGLLVGTDRHSH